MTFAPFLTSINPVRSVETMQHHAGYAGDKGVKVEMEADTEGAGGGIPNFDPCPLKERIQDSRSGDDLSPTILLLRYGDVEKTIIHLYIYIYSYTFICQNPILLHFFLSKPSHAFG